MKKQAVVGIALLLSLYLTGCGSSTTSTEDTSSSEEQTEEAVAAEDAVDEQVEEESSTTKPERDLPEGSYEEVGDGTLYLVNQSGSTEYGDDIVVYPDMDSVPLAYVDYELWDLDGSVLTYIYLDGVEMDKQQVGAGMQASLGLIAEWQVTPGEHIVEAVQYANNDTSAEITFYRSASFTVVEA